MQVQINEVTMGNIKYSLTANLSETALQAACREGVTRVLQGPVATEWEKGAIALTFEGCKERKDIEAKIDKGELPEFLYPEGHKKAGQRRPFTRTDIPFTKEIAELFVKCAKNAEIIIGENADGEALKEALGIDAVTTEEYSGAAAAVPKFAREKEFVRGYLAANGGKLKDGSARTAASFAENRGIEAPTEPWDEDTTFLAAVKVWLSEYLAKQAQNE